MLFFSSISVCNLKDYDTVLNLQRTKISHNAPVQRLKITAFVVPVTVFRYIPRVVLLSGLQALYINDSNRPPNKMKQSWAPFKSPQFRPDIVAIRIGPRMEKWKIMSPYRMPPIWALSRPPMRPAGPVFLTLRPGWALGPRLCSLSVSGLAVENSASVETRIKTVCDHAAQKICD